MANKVLILGAAGMLGHKLVQVLSGKFEVVGTVRSMSPELQQICGSTKIIDNIRGEEFETIARVFLNFKPDTVINCIGIVKQLAEAKDPVKSIEINALLPNRIANLCSTASARFIQISTDCVFAGSRGNYCESDTPDAADLYGRSKALGEVTAEGSLTIRTSIIGHQLHGSNGLVEWFLQHSGKNIPGYRQAIFTGLPTVCLADVIGAVLNDYPNLSGLFHVSSDRISKFDLLKLMSERYAANMQIVPDDSVVYDRSLNSERFRKATAIRIPSWPDMIERMHEDGAIYDRQTKRDLIKH